MSNKLLNEGTIRRFMKLAALKPITDEVISEMAYVAEVDEIEEEELDLGADLGDEVEVEADLDVPVDDEVEPAPENEDLLKRVVQAVAAELDVEVEIEGDEGDAEDVEAEDVLDVEDGAEVDAEVDAELEAPILEEEPGMLEAVEAMLAEAGVEVVDDEAITEGLIKKVSARVAKRLLKEFS